MPLHTRACSWPGRCLCHPPLGFPTTPAAGDSNDSFYTKSRLSTSGRGLLILPPDSSQGLAVLRDDSTDHSRLWGEVQSCSQFTSPHTLVRSISESSRFYLTVDRIMAPKDAQALIPGICKHVTLRGKRDFTNTMKVEDLGTGRSSWIVWADPMQPWESLKVRIFPGCGQSER